MALAEARGQQLQHPFKVSLRPHQEIGSNLVWGGELFALPFVIVWTKAVLIYKSLG